MPLSEQDRSRLDSIVQQMEANGEPEDAIRFVVGDFKSKYDKPAEVAPAKPESSIAEDFGSAVGGALSEVGNAAKGLGTLGAGALYDAGRMLYQPIDATKSQINRAKQVGGSLLEGVSKGVSKHSRAFRDAADGDWREKTAQGLMAVGSLVPGMAQAFDIGHKAVGMSPETGQESVLDADPRAGGQLGGQLAMASLERLPWAKGHKAFVDPLSKGMGARQVARYAQGIKPTKGNIPAAQELAAEAIERGIYGTSKGLNKQGAVGAEKTGKAIGDIFRSERGQTPASIDPVINALEELAQKGVKGGQEFAPELNAAARSLQEKVRAMAEAKGGQPSAFDLWELKQLWDDPVARRGAFAPGADPALTAKLQAQEAAANAAREALGEALPEVKPLNKDYHFYKQLEELTDPQVMSQAPSFWKEAGKMAGVGAAGALVGLPGGVITGAVLFKLGSTILNSPLYKTFTAVQRAKIAKALQAKDAAGVASAYVDAGGKVEDLSAPELWDGLERPLDELQGIRTPSDVAVDSLRAEGIPDVWEGPSPEASMGLAEAADELRLRELDQANFPEISASPIPQDFYSSEFFPESYANQVDTPFGRQTIQEAANFRPQPGKSLPTPPKGLPPVEQPMWPEGGFEGFREELPTNTSFPPQPPGTKPELTSPAISDPPFWTGPPETPLTPFELEMPQGLKPKAEQKLLEAINRTIKNPTFQALEPTKQQQTLQNLLKRYIR